MNVGKIVQVIGPTVDVVFDPDQLGEGKYEEAVLA